MKDAIINASDYEAFDNYVGFVLALSFTVDGLQDFVQNSLESLQEDINQKLKGMPNCNSNCSRNKGDNFSKWCPTCALWKAELEKEKGKGYRFKNWNKIHSIDFHQSFEEIGKVYVKDSTVSKYGTFRDIGSILSLFENCSRFKLDNLILSDVRCARNEFFAHNYTRIFHKPDKIRCINYLIKLLQFSDIKQTQSAKRCLPILLKLLHSNDVIAEIRNCKNNIEESIKIQLELKNLDVEEREQVFKLIVSRLNSQTYKKVGSPIRTFISRRRFRLRECVNVLLLIFIPIGCILWLTANNSEEDTSFGCLNINSDIIQYGSQVIDDYRSYLWELYNETSVVEREWLHQRFEANFMLSRSILLIADPGYGKTSLISKLVCANQSSLWLSLRNTVVFYHICRFDRSSTQKPSGFIIKLAFVLRNTFHIIGNFYETDLYAKEYLNGEYQCSKDPVSCFDHLILHPIRLYHDEFPDKTFTFIVDALDECQTTDEKYDIFELLWMHIPKFPSDLKFVFILTSRNIEEIVSKFATINSFNVLNINEYRQEFDKDIFSYVTEREMSLPWSINKTEIVKVFNGNFLYAKYFLDYCSIQSHCTPSDVPVSLRDSFELNLKRIFGKGAEQFEKIRPIFEVLAAASKPITEEELLCISNADPKLNMYSLIGKELRHFVNIDSKQSISFKHKAFRDFLTNFSNRHSMFYIDRNNGHKRFATYLLESLNTTKDVDILDLAHHVALSKNQHFEDMFLLYASDMLYYSNSTKGSILHKVVKNYNCYNTTTMIIKLIGAGYIDDRNEENQTSSFIATENGHGSSLNALLEFGANIDFLKFCEPLKSVYDYDESYCGYSLLEIAAKRGYHEVVNCLLKRKPNLINHKNINRQNAVHVASQNGNLKIVEEILQMNITRTFLDSYALYLAANGGFYDIVQVMLKNNVTDICLPCNGTLYWKNESVLDEKFGRDTESYWIWPNEIRLFKCETALHAAVNKGHRNIVELLLNEKINALQCRNAAGLTPLLLALESNQNDIFVYLYESVSNKTDQCINHIRFVDQRRLSWHFSLPRPEIPCYRNGTSIMHLLARYDNIQITKYLLNKGVSNWLQYDDNGASTVHYALCYGSKNFISLISSKLNFSSSLLEKTKDGYTPYQYAAGCGNPLDMLDFPKMFDGRQHEIKDDFDMFGRNLLQLAIMHISPYDVSTSVKHFQLAISSKHDLFHLDNDKNNFLHYAALHGNSEMLKQGIVYFSDTEMRKLLAQKNKNGFKPISLSVRTFQFGDEHNSIRDIDKIISSYLFFGQGEKFYFDFQYESFSLFALYSSLNSVLTFWDIHDVVLHLLFSVQPLPLVLFRWYYTEEFTYIISNINLDGNNHLLDLFAKHPYMVYIFLPPNVTNYCKDRNNNGFLHKIVMNYRDKYWKCFENTSIWEKYFKDYNAQTLDRCFDSDGYNIFQRAVAGGNIKIMSILLEKNISLKISTKISESVLVIALKFFPFIIHNFVIRKTYNETSTEIPYEYSLGKPETFWTAINDKPHGHQHVVSTMNLVGHQHFVSTMDFLTSLKKLISHINRKKNLQTIVRKSEVCPHHKRKFGLLHMASAKGYLEFVEFATELYGKSIINCSTFHKVTPKYLSLLFNQGHVMSWISGVDQSNVFPSTRIKHLLASLYVTNLNQRPNVDWTCFLTYSYRKSTLIRRQLNRCVDQVFNNTGMCVLCSISDLNTTYRYFKSVLNLILGDRYNSLNTSETIENILQMNKKTYNILLYLYKLYREVLYFGLGDRKMIYTMLSYDLKVRTNITHGISYSKQLNNETQYFKAITFNKDEYGPWIRAKMIHMMEEPVQCRDLRAHERNIKTWHVLKARRELMQLADNTYCKENQTCELRNSMSGYFNQTILCNRVGFNALLKLSNLRTYPVAFLNINGSILREINSQNVNKIP